MAEENIKYVHLEGMDLAGKSVIASNFTKASQEEWQIRRNSVSENNPIYHLANSINKSKDQNYSSETLGNLYIAALMADIEGFSRPTVNTIQDSTIILRSLAYHTINGTPRIAEVMTGLIPKYPKFDHSFFLTADIETRLVRLQKRYQEDPQEITLNDQLIVRNPNKFMTMNECLMELSVRYFNSIIVDTTKTLPEEATDLLISKVY